MYYNSKRLIQFLSLGVILCLLPPLKAQSVSKKIKVLIIDGHNNHDWCGTTDFLRASLEATGIFTVKVSTAPSEKSPRAPRKTKNPNFKADLQKAKSTFTTLIKKAKNESDIKFHEWQPDFHNSDVVVLNYNGREWPKNVQLSFINYIKNGGGTVLVHGANNAFKNWQEFNDIIGLGWRKNNYGKAIKVNPQDGTIFTAENKDLINDGNSAHGSKHPFQITVRAASHPIMKGIPKTWMHATDELYHNMRGPAKNLTVLSSAYSNPKERGTGLHEPMTWEVKYGKGRAIVTSMGHLWKGDMRHGRCAALQCVGFQTIFNRACEYAATQKVSLPIPEEFPTADKVSLKEANQINWFKTKTSLSAADASMKKKKAANPYCMLTPEEELATFELAPGYVAELFASEPMITEPVLTVWDADGALYVAEMNSYMQDVANTDIKTMRNSKIKKLLDTDGDGKADKVTVFADNLNLPRAILPLGDWIAVRETDTMDVIAFKDNDGDGVADEKKILYKRGPVGRNAPYKSVEHQDSGLMWNLDNQIYLTYNMERYRYTDGKWKAEPQRGHWTQWGLTHDDVGDIYWSTNSAVLTQAYIHPRYWNIPGKVSDAKIPRIPIMLPEHYDGNFKKAYSLCELNDRGGKVSANRNFTSACGQSIYRSDKFPYKDRGSHFICDPTIHVIRRSYISKESDMVKLTKAEAEGTEFLRSSDINSRFVNTAEGPDGCLYVTDMYRGIIQDAQWLNPQSRKNIVDMGLDKNIQHGRIWRIRHKDFTPRKHNEMPKMSQESTFSLLRFLSHEAGWWRDTAQREIILRRDLSIVPQLKGMARFAENPLERLHALWTLEGLDSINLKFLEYIIVDHDPRLRRAAIQIGERYFEQTEAINLLVKPLSNEPNSSVAKQLILSLGLMAKSSTTVSSLIEKLCRKHSTSMGVQLAASLSLWGMNELPLIKEIYAGNAFPLNINNQWRNMISNWSRGIKFAKNYDNSEKKRIESGGDIYFKSCISCHGPDGKGVGLAGTEMMLAPSLVDSKRVKGPSHQLIPVFTHGLTGPIEGKSYQAGFMAPAHVLGINRDDRLSELISYIRYAFGDKASSVSANEVKNIKSKYQNRQSPWTDKELIELK